MSLVQKLFSFEGRLRRRDYWVLSILMGLAAFVVGEAVVVYGFGPEHGAFAEGAALSPVQRIKNLVVALVLLWPMLAVSAKRAHDRAKSAKLTIGILLLVSIISNGTSLFVEQVLAGDEAILLSLLGATLVSLVASLYLLVTLGCLDGTGGENRFGPNPKRVAKRGLAD